MRGLTSRERLMFALVIAGAIAAVFYLLILSPTDARIATLNRDLTKQRTELKKLQDLSATKADKEREFAALADRIKLIEGRLPPEREIPTLIRQLQDTAGELGIRLVLLRPGATQSPAAPAGSPRPTQPQPQQPAPAAQAPPYQLFRLDLSFDGTYADLMAFLGRLENFPRFIVLKQVAVSPSDLPKLKVTLAADTFLLPRERLAQPTR